MDQTHLLAVAVHDRTEMRLEPVDVKEVEARVGDTPVFRVSYRLADTSGHREAAHLKASFRVDKGPWEVQETSMRDRPLADDTATGSLQIHVGPLTQGEHVVEYRLEAQSSDKGLVPGRGSLHHQASLAGSVRIRVS